MTRRISILIAGASLLALSCVYSYRLEKVENRTWRPAGITGLSARTQNGEIELTAATDTLITATITRRCQGRDSGDAENAIKNVVVTDSVGGGRLFVKATMPVYDAHSYGAGFALTLPDTVHFDLASNDGAIDITGMVGGGAISTTNGAITLTDTRGPIAATTSNGAVTIIDHHGTLDITSSNGALACGVVELTSTDHVALNTSNGAVTLYLPVWVSAHFDASTSNGEVSISGFPSVTHTRNESTHKSGNIGGGAASVVISTSNGSVSMVGR